MLELKGRKIGMTYYDVLMVKNTATDAEIKTAYRNLLKAFHPDYYAGPKEFGEQQTRRIVEAYKVLHDPEKRKAYDDFLIRNSKDSKTQQNSDQNIKKDSKQSDDSEKAAAAEQQKKNKNNSKNKAGVIIFLIAMSAMLLLFVKDGMGFYFKPAEQNEISLLANTKYELLVSADFKEIANEGIGSDWNFTAGVNGKEIISEPVTIPVEKNTEIRIIAKAIEKDAVHDDIGRTSGIYVFDEGFFEEVYQQGEKVIEKTFSVKEDGIAEQKKAQILVTYHFSLLEG